MSKMLNWAENELTIAGVENKGQLIEIVRVFGNQGHSGFSASYALSFINTAVEQGYDVVEKKLNDMLRKIKNDDGMQQTITDDIIEILNLFKKYNLGKLEAHNVSRLMTWKPISKLTGEDNEWAPVPEYDNGSKTQQNKRCSAVFRDNYDNTTARYIDGKVFSDDGGKTWWSNKNSHINVEFPYDIPDKPEQIILEDGALE